MCLCKFDSVVGDSDDTCLVEAADGFFENLFGDTKLAVDVVGRGFVAEGEEAAALADAVVNLLFGGVNEFDAALFEHRKYTFFLSHYPSLTANYDEDKSQHERVINLCGHTHTTDRFNDWDLGLIYHVELDAHDNKPVTIDEIISDITDKLGRS